MSRSSGPLRSPKMVGRDREKDTVVEALDHLESGHGAGLVVSGEAGIGKSRLVEWLAEEISRRGGVMLLGRASDAGTPTALAPVQEALIGATSLTTAISSGRLDDLAPLLGHLLPHPGQPLAVDPTPVLLGHAVLHGLAAAAPGITIVIEDLHAADGDTIALVRHMLGQAGSVPVLVVATTRLERVGPELIAASQAAGATVLRLDRLTAPQAREVARSLFGGRGDGVDRVESHLQVADGLPLLIEDLVADFLDVDAAADGGTPTGAVHVPGRFAEVVRGRLGRLDPVTAGVVSAAAVLGPALSLNLLPLAAGRGEAELREAVSEAARAQLLTADGSAFRHALTRDVVLASTPMFEHVTIAQRVAPAIENPPTSLLAPCAELLVLAGDRDNAARLLITSARHEHRSGAGDTAATRLERALEVVECPDLKATATMASIETLIDLGRLTDANHLASQFETALSADARIDAWLLLAAGAADMSRQAPMDANLLAAMSLMGEDDPRRARAAVLEARRTLQFAEDSDRRDQAEAAAESAVVAARRIGDHQALCDAHIIIGRCARFRDLRAAEAAYETALRIAVANGFSRQHLDAMHELGTIDMLGGAGSERLLLARDQAVGSGALTTLVSVQLNLAGAGLLSGRFHETVEAASEAERLATQLGLVHHAGMAKTWYAAAIGFLGERERSDALLRQVAVEHPDDAVIAFAIDWHTRLPLAVAWEDRAEMRRLAQIDRPQSELMHLGSAWLLLIGAMERRLDADAIGNKIGEVPSAARPLATRVIEGAALAIATGHVDPEAANAVAAEYASDFDADLQIARFCLRFLGEAALDDGWGEPERWLRDAHHHAIEAGFGEIAAATQALLQRLDGERADPARRDGPEIPEELRQAGVTRREWNVLRLLVGRPTNAELADQLHLSVRTVEKHVSSLLAKLHVASRRDLARLAASHGWGSAPDA